MSWWESGGCPLSGLVQMTTGKCKVEGPQGFECSYTLVGEAGEHQPEIIRNVLIKLCPRGRDDLPRPVRVALWPGQTSQDLAGSVLRDGGTSDEEELTQPNPAMSAPAR